MENLLIDAGLTKLQAQAYLYLLERGPTPPKLLMGRLSISRTNTYKVLESLEKIGLARKDVSKSKTVYLSESPSALASLVAEQRNSVLALEHNVNKAVQKLNASFRRQQKGIKIETQSGKKAMLEAYNKQAEARQPIYFVKSRSDITFMGFEAMDSIRKKQGKLSQHRYGITTDSPEAPMNNQIDKAANLTRTWIKESDYTAPVEWSVSGNSIIIQVFDREGKTVFIESEVIADSFRQLWQIADRAIRDSDQYIDLPLRALREI